MQMNATITQSAEMSVICNQITAGVFKVLGVGWELPPKFRRIFYLGGNSPALFYFEVVFGMLLNTVLDLMNIINNYSNYHGVSEKKSQIDHLYN